MDGQDQNRDRTSGHSEFSPGEAVSIRPAEPVAAPAPQAPSAASPLRPSSEPTLPGQPAVVTASPSAPAAAPFQAAPAVAVGDPASAALPDEAEADFAEPQDDLSWTASEFIAHHKTSQWYVILAGGTLVAAALVYLITRDFIAVAVTLLCAVLFGVSASRPPRELQYGLNAHGIRVGQKGYLYSDFRSFSIIEEGPFSSLNFMPLKRFSPPLSIYYDPEHEEEIVNMLSQHLPLSHHGRTVVEGLMHRIRF